MERMTLEEILEAVEGNIVIKGSFFEECIDAAGCAGSIFSGVSTDSRKIEKDNIFIALKGENFNGNDYIVQVSKAGAALCIVDEIKFNKDEINSSMSVIIVKDTRKALLSLAKLYRSKLSVKIIGITGSTGKTSTKDLTAAVLSSKFKTFKTAGNYNNEIGLPLMIFKLDNTYDAAVLEMGMSNFQEIHRLADTARLDIALITNIGLSHIENLKSRENILKAKLEITDFFDNEKVLIVNGEDELLKTIKNKDYKVLKTGMNSEFDFYAQDIKLSESNVRFILCEKEKNTAEEFIIEVPGRHNILNAMLAVACGRTLGMGYKEIKEGIKNLQTTSMRLDIIRGDKFTIIDDCYNASPDSMKAAIDVVADIKGNRRIAVLGTMRELGDSSYEAHKEIGKYAKDKSIDILLTMGEFNNAYKEGYEKPDTDGSIIKSFDNNNDLIEFLKNTINKDDLVLVKASRYMKFENIVNEIKKING